MNFSKAFSLKNDIIAIIGMGGKTTLCYTLAKENADKKTILTTSTKMLPIKAEDLGLKEHFYAYYDELMPLKIQKGVNVFGKFFYADRVKISMHENMPELMKLSELFIYEADGSKCKALKAWKQDEPVILKGTTLVIGVFPIFMLGEKICEQNTHRFDLFCEKFHAQKNEILDENLVLKIILEMFSKTPKNARKILFLNRYTNENLDFLNKLDMQIFAGEIKTKSLRKIK